MRRTAALIAYFEGDLARALQLSERIHDEVQGALLQGIILYDQAKQSKAARVLTRIRRKDARAACYLALCEGGGVREIEALRKQEVGAGLEAVLKVFTGQEEAESALRRLRELDGPEGRCRAYFFLGAWLAHQGEIDVAEFALAAAAQANVFVEERKSAARLLKRVRDRG